MIGSLNDVAPRTCYGKYEPGEATTGWANRMRPKSTHEINSLFGIGGPQIIELSPQQPATQ